jgi:hypothetical protein
MDARTSLPQSLAYVPFGFVLVRDFLAAFVVNSELHTGARPAVRLSVGTGRASSLCSSAIVAGCWRAPGAFLTASFFPWRRALARPAVPVQLIGRHEDAQACVLSPFAHHVSPRAEQIVNLTLSRCQRLSQGVGQRRRLFSWPSWPQRTLLLHDFNRASRKPVPPCSPSAGYFSHGRRGRCVRYSGLIIKAQHPLLLSCRT